LGTANTYTPPITLPEYISQTKAGHSQKTLMFKTSKRQEFGNLALFKPSFSSSFEDMNFLPCNVVDNDSSTRWSSDYY